VVVGWSLRGHSGEVEGFSGERLNGCCGVGWEWGWGRLRGCQRYPVWAEEGGLSAPPCLGREVVSATLLEVPLLIESCSECRIFHLSICWALCSG